MRFSKGYTKVDQVVRSFLLKQGKNYLHDYLQYLNFTLDELRGLQLDVANDVKTVIRSLDKQKRVKIPDDIIGLPSKIGIQFGDRVYALPNDPTLSICDSKEGLAIKARKEPTPFVYEFLNLQTEQGNMGPIMGYGWGHNGIGYYNINEKDHMIYFSSDVNNKHKIYIEYVSNDFCPSTETLVSAIHVELLQAGLGKEIAKYRFGNNSGEYQAAKREYLDMEDNVLSRQSDISYSGIMDALHRNYSQGIAP